MAAEQGFRIARMLIIGFMIVAVASIASVAVGMVEVVDLKDIFGSLGQLATVFGVQAIIAALVVSRGQTSNSP